MIDVDNFKRINDSLGHHFGDITLQKTADFIRKHFLKENHESFRIGGDEYAVIAKEVSSQDIVFDERVKSKNNKMIANIESYF